MDASELILSDREFSRIRRRVRAIAGIALSDAKRILVVARLSKLLRAKGFSSFDRYLDHLETRGSEADAQAFVNALTTNLTRFWREEHHFEHLAEQLRLRAMAGAGRPRLRIWSAGCSSGQEAYSLALTACTALPNIAELDFRILATDIDTAMLARAAGGTYRAGELAGLDTQKAALFEHAGPDLVRVPEAARQLVTFKPLNLMNAWPMRGRFDAIFCRNVAIYFDRSTQLELFARLADLLTEDGFLYIGHSENVGDTAGLESVGSTIYRKRAGVRRSAA
jgi:chemotaxis protein methyltransferase CheR